MNIFLPTCKALIHSIWISSVKFRKLLILHATIASFIENDILNSFLNSIFKKIEVLQGSVCFLEQSHQWNYYMCRARLVENS